MTLKAAIDRLDDSVFAAAGMRNGPVTQHEIALVLAYRRALDGVLEAMRDEIRTRYGSLRGAR